MLLDRLAETWTAVAATRSRNAKRDLLAATLADAGPDDLEIAVSYLGGALRQRRPGLGWRGLAELPEPAHAFAIAVRAVTRRLQRGQAAVNVAQAHPGAQYLAHAPAV